MDIPTIKAWPREKRGTRASRRLRGRGLVPAVLYGRGEPNLLLSVQEKAISHIVAEHAMVLQLEWDGHQTPTQLKEVQFDSLGEEILHADFHRISLTETVRVAVPIETHGEPVGVAQEGGMLAIVQHEVEVECLPTSIPESIRVEVAGLSIGDNVRLGALDLPDGVAAVGDPDLVVISVTPPTEVPEEEELAPAEELMAEPEVIGREEEEKIEEDLARREGKADAEKP